MQHEWSPISVYVGSWLSNRHVTCHCVTLTSMSLWCRANAVCHPKTHVWCFSLISYHLHRTATWQNCDACRSQSCNRTTTGATSRLVSFTVTSYCKNLSPCASLITLGFCSLWPLLSLLPANDSRRLLLYDTAECSPWFTEGRDSLSVCLSVSVCVCAVDGHSEVDRHLCRLICSVQFTPQSSLTVICAHLT